MTKPIKLSCLYKVLASYHSDTSLYSCFNKLTRLNTNSHNVPSSVKSWFWLILFFVFYDKTDKVVLLQMSKALCIVVFLMVVTLTAKRARCVQLVVTHPKYCFSSNIFLLWIFFYCSFLTVSRLTQFNKIVWTHASWVWCYHREDNVKNVPVMKSLQVCRILLQFNKIAWTPAGWFNWLYNIYWQLYDRVFAYDLIWNAS